MDLPEPDLIVGQTAGYSADAVRSIVEEALAGCAAEPAPSERPQVAALTDEQLERAWAAMFDKPDVWLMSKPAVFKFVRTLAAAPSERGAASDVQDALYDSAYIAGAQAGYNCETPEKLRALIAARDGYLKPIIAARSERGAAEPSEETLRAMWHANSREDEVIDDGMRAVYAVVLAAIGAERGAAAPERYVKREGAYAGSEWKPANMVGKLVLESVAVPGLLHIFSAAQMDAAAATPPAPPTGDAT